MLSGLRGRGARRKETRRLIRRAIVTGDPTLVTKSAAWSDHVTRHTAKIEAVERKLAAYGVASGRAEIPPLE
jgi:hypothetical protein